MILRREALAPIHRRPPRNPIPVILGLLLLATFASAAMDNRQLRRRAEAAEERELDLRFEKEVERLRDDFKELQLQEVRRQLYMRPDRHHSPPNPGAGDFAVPPDGPRAL